MVGEYADRNDGLRDVGGCVPHGTQRAFQISELDSTTQIHIKRYQLAVKKLYVIHSFLCFITPLQFIYFILKNECSDVSATAKLVRQTISSI